MGPIDYSIDVATPFASALQGYQAGAAIRNDQQQQQQQQAEAQARQQMQSDLYALSSNKNATGADYASVMTKYPQLSEQLTKSWSALDGAQRQSKLQQGTQAYAAILSGKPEVAETLFRERAVAARNSGMEDAAKQSETMADLIKLHPESARTSIALSLAAEMGPDKFATTFSQLGSEQRAEDLAPAALSEANAKASSAATAAKFAESKAVQDLRMGDEQIKKWAADTEISRMNTKIAAMNAATARESNAVKLEELRLKRDEAITARDDKLRGKVAEVDSARSTIDNTINTIDKLFNNPAWKDVVGSFEGRMPESASMMDDKESDAIATINTIGSQVFLSAVKGAGSMTGLTEKEGDKLQNSLASMGRAQSEEAFETNAREAQRLLLKARKNLVIKYGIPDTTPDTPQAGVNAGEIDALLKKYGGK